MHKSVLTVAGFAAAALMLGSPAEAAKVTYIPVPAPAGSTVTTVFSINDQNIIAGSYRDSSSVEHGFFGPLDGSNYTTFDLGVGETGTEPRSISNDGTIVGLATNPSEFTYGEEFYRAPDGTVKIVKKRKLIFDGVAQGLNGKNLFMGDYVDSSGIREGYEGRNGNDHAPFSLPIQVTSTNPRALNDIGMVVGSYVDNGGVTHGFSLSGGTMNVYDYPDSSAQITVVEGVNNSGVASGLWQDTSANRHVFTVDTATNTFMSLDPGDGSTFQQGWGINNAGLVALDTTADNGITYNSYIYCPMRARKCPKGGTEVEAHPIHVPAGTFLHYDRFGHTGHGAPAKLIRTKAPAL
jgi:hypothetical protein